MLKFSMFHKFLKICLFSFVFVSCADCDEPEPDSFLRRQAERGEDGASCFFDSECVNGKCDTTFNLGYCTAADDCKGGCIGPDAFCLGFLSGREQCVDGCKSSAECRTNYDCIQVYDSQSACLPKKHPGPTSGQLGASCDKDECHPGLDCLPLNEKGYCAGDCKNCDDGICEQIDGKEYCLAACLLSSECQLNDRCVEGSCRPQALNRPAFENSKKVLGMLCDAKMVGEFTYEFEFGLKANTSSFSITTVLADGNFKILEVEKDGNPFEVATTYRHHNQRLLGLERYPAQSGSYGSAAFDWTIVVPYAPQFSSLVDVDARYTLRVQSPTEPPCMYLLESSGGTELSIDLYFASDLFSEKDAGNDADLQEILTVLKELYQKAGIDISTIRYHDLTPTQKERFARTNSSEIRALTALGIPQSETLDGYLSVDVFMVDDIFGSAAGVSPSLPGPPGLHGSPNNGLVFSVADAGFDNEVIGYIMAHEIGHYLGLRHTSETFRGETREYVDELVGVEDPILDTLICDEGIEDCGEEDNLMYPTIPDLDDRVGQISEGQGKALRANPLIR